MSQLTVPKAGVDPGPVATSRVQGGDLGSSARQLGRVMVDVGTQLESDRLDRQMKRLGVDLTRDMNQLAIDLRQIGDPDQLEAAFQAGVEDLRHSYLKGQSETGRPRVDPRNVDAFNLAFDDLRNSHERGIGQRSLAGRFAQREATYQEYAHQAVVAASTADPDTRQLYLENGEAHITALEQAGVIDAKEASRRRLVLQSDMDSAAALRMMDEDPAELLEALDAGEFDGLGGEAMSRFRSTANARIAAAQAKEQKSAEVALKAEEKLVTDRLKEMAGIWDLGQRSVDEDAFLSRPDVQANPYFAEAIAHRQLLLEQPSLNSMKPSELREAIEGEKARPKVFKYQAERLGILETKLAAEEKAWATDPLAHARSKGMPVPVLPDFDPANPGEFATALSQFKATSAALVENGWTENTAIFDKATSEQLRTVIGETVDPHARATLAGVVVGSIGDRKDVLDELTIAPSFRFAGGLQIAGGSQDVAVSVMRGQAAIDAGTIILPPTAERLDAAFGIVSDLFQGLPGGASNQAMIMAAADARYVDTSGRLDPAGDIDSNAYLQSVHEVMGGSGAWDSGNARGGIQDVLGQQTILPMGVSADEVEDALSKLGRVLEEQAPIGLLEEHLTTQLADDLTAISDNGQPPMIGGQSLNVTSISRMQIRAVEDGLYEFFYVSQSGRILVPRTENGETYRFRMSALLRGAAQ